MHAPAPAARLVGAVAFVGACVATPAGAWPVLIAELLLVLALLAWARVPARDVARRSLIELPFVIFALLLPFLASGPRIEFFGLQVSEAGAHQSGLMLAKATIGVLVAILLTATTSSEELLDGLHRLRLPPAILAIMSFMLRYMVVIADDLRRARTARAARGFRGSGLEGLRIEATGAGALFVRSYERGERVHRAMLARGYDGVMPGAMSAPVPARDWALALIPASAAILMLVTAILMIS